MCKKMTFLICIASVLALANSAQALEIKCDISCPGNASMKAGGDWTDFEWDGGCDGKEHDGRNFTIDGVNFFAGNPGGHCNIWHDGGGDPLTNNAYGNPWVGEDTRMLFTISNLNAGDYQVVVVGEGGASGTYNFTSTGTGDVWTVIDAEGPGLDNFILTGGGQPEPQACCMPDGSCDDLTEEDCAAQGGAAQGEGTACSGTTIACCVADGECVDADPLCCDDLDGTPGYADMCLGDLNGNDIDDACEEPCACIGDMDDSGQRSLADLDALVNLLVGAGPPFIVPCPDVACYCADFDDSGQVSLADLDAMVNLLVAAGPPFIVDCEPN